MKIVGNAFGARAVLKLMYAALIRASGSWRGIQMKPFEVKQLEAMRAELDAESHVFCSPGGGPTQ